MVLPFGSRFPFLTGPQSSKTIVLFNILPPTLPQGLALVAYPVHYGGPGLQCYSRRHVWPPRSSSREPGGTIAAMERYYSQGTHMYKWHRLSRLRTLSGVSNWSTRPMRWALEHEIDPHSRDHGLQAATR
jgi:hypothetical protein